MNADSTTLTRQLAKGEILRLPQAAGSAVACLQGSLWVTEDADPLDHVLESGQCLRLQRPGTTLVMALAPTRLRVTPARARPGRGAGAAARLFDRLAMGWAQPMRALGSWA
jgi:hypothetical protein